MSNYLALNDVALQPAKIKSRQPFPGPNFHIALMVMSGVGGTRSSTIILRDGSRQSPHPRRSVSIRRWPAPTPPNSSSQATKQPIEWPISAHGTTRLLVAEYDENAAAADLNSAFAAGDGAGAEGALCDSSRSMAQMQREVQRKLQEQIEVQRHLQLRIEAQGRYLQSVLRRAQEVLAGHGSPELSELPYAVETGSLSSSSSSLSPSPPRHSSAAGSCVTSPSSEAESHAAAGSKRPCTCAVEQPVQGKRTFLESHEVEEADAEEEGDGNPARKTPTKGKETTTRSQWCRGLRWAIDGLLCGL